jgi:hypothetical protein
MALVRRPAIQRSTREAIPGLACVRQGACVPVATRRAVRLRWVRACAGGWATGAGGMALVTGCAYDRIGAEARACLAGIRSSAGVSVVTDDSVWLRRIRANSRCRIAGPRRVALIGGRTGYGVAARADPGLAGVGPGTCICVVAGRPIGLWRIRTMPGGNIASAGLVTLILCKAGDGICTGARAGLAAIRLSTSVPVVTGCAVRLRRVGASPACGIASPSLVTLVSCNTGDRIAAAACAGLAGVGSSASVPVVAGGAVRLRWVRARSRRRIACSCLMALVACQARYGVRTNARACLARVCLSASVSIGTRRPVRLTWVGACTSVRVTGASNVALVRRLARDRIRANAGACLARVRLGTSVSIVAAAAIGFGRIGADSAIWIARANLVALILGQTRHGTAANTGSSLA